MWVYSLILIKITLFVKHPVIGGLLRLAPDNKIYYVCGYDFNLPNCYPYPDSVRNMYNENLGIINFPDSLGNSCNFQPSVLTLVEKEHIMVYQTIQITV
jgi:hypothetical protein